MLEWFSSGAARPAVVVERAGPAPAVMQVRGAVELQVPWLPCADYERMAALTIGPSLDPVCTAVAVAGFESAPPPLKRETIAALDDLFARGTVSRLVVFGQDARSGDLTSHFGDRAELVAPLTPGNAHRVEVACVVHAGFTDDCAFGTVLLAQSGLPAVAAGTELGTLLSPDVATIAKPGELAARVAYFVNDVQARARYGMLLEADARRRFSPRRSAIRVVDLLCAARFGLERPSAARSNTPLAR